MFDLNETKEKDEQQVPMALFALLQQHFEKAGAEDCLRRTTLDIWRIVETHAPGVFSLTEVYKALDQEGYLTQMVDEEVYWLVRPR